MVRLYDAWHGCITSLRVGFLCCSSFRHVLPLAVQSVQMPIPTILDCTSMCCLLIDEIPVVDIALVLFPDDIVLHQELKELNPDAT